MFTTFSRAFFAEPHLISMAELIKSFHYYFLSNDLGLVYDVLNDDFEKTLWKPAKDFLNGFNSKINLSIPVESFSKSEDRFVINNEEFDYTILATDVRGTKKIIEDSDYIKSRC
jgi:isorenieratene synthase